MAAATTLDLFMHVWTTHEEYFVVFVQKLV